MRKQFRQCVCGIKFYPAHHNQKYHNIECRASQNYEPASPVTRDCVTCGLPFETHARKYCSDKCAKIGKARLKRLSHPLKPRERVCRQCGLSFEASSPYEVMCSDDCRHDSLLASKKRSRESEAGRAATQLYLKNNAVRLRIQRRAYHKRRRALSPAHRKALRMRRIVRSKAYRRFLARREQMQRLIRYYRTRTPENVAAERVRQKQRYAAYSPKLLQRRREGAAAYYILVEHGIIQRVPTKDLRKAHRDARRVFISMGLIFPPTTGVDNAAVR